MLKDWCVLCCDLRGERNKILFLSVPGCVVSGAVAFPGLRGKAVGSGTGAEGSSSAGEAGWASRRQLPPLSLGTRQPGWGRGSRGSVPRAAQTGFVLAAAASPSPLPAALFSAASSSFINSRSLCEGSA